MKKEMLWKVPALKMNARFMSKKIPLTTSQKDDLSAYLEEVELGILAKAKKLQARGAVRNIQWNPEEESIEAMVYDSRHYHPTLFLLGDHDVLTDCSCSFEGDYCRHALAVVMQVLEDSEPVGSPVPESPARSGVGQSAVEGEATQAAVAGVDSLPPLQKYFKERMGGKVSSAALRCLNKVDEWWSQRKADFTADELSGLCGHSYYWGWKPQRLCLWSKESPPADLVEYLMHITLGLNDLHLSLPGGLAAALDPTELTRVREKLQRAQEIHTWRKFLGDWIEPAATHADLPVLRLMLLPEGATVQVRHAGESSFGKTTKSLLKQLWGGPVHQSEPQNELALGSNLVLKAARTPVDDMCVSEIAPMSGSLTQSLRQLVANPEWRDAHLANPRGGPLAVTEVPLRWELIAPRDSQDRYSLFPCDATGEGVPPPIAILPGTPLTYVTTEGVYPLDYWPFGSKLMQWPAVIPGAALETREGVSALNKLGVPLPSKLEGRVKIVGAEVLIRCRIESTPNSNYFQVQAGTTFPGTTEVSRWTGTVWKTFVPAKDNGEEGNEILQFDKTAQRAAAAWLGQLKLKPVQTGGGNSVWVEERLQGKEWPGEILAWLDQRPRAVRVEVDAEIASLQNGQLAGKVRLDVEESKTGIDWFDLSIALDVSDHTLTQEEIKLLLRAKGKWVKLSGKGWRKLDFEMTETELRELAELGLAVSDFGVEKQRLHALQLGALRGSHSGLLSSERVEQVRRRVEELQTRVTPALPEDITATLRPYQLDGFHFLAYLAVNRFGGVLADDMGLGKTLQTLTWIAWLRNEKHIKAPVLVVCPKSVQDNWRSEAGRFFPTLTVDAWDREKAGETGLKGEVDLLIIHYAQLRIHASRLCAREWGAVILDEAQAIKNPTSQNAKAACDLNSQYRLALTGTPIENRLLDLWSIFSFAMPGVLGNRASFNRDFDAREDPLARRRLAARTRPFLLRRTKGEVARDLPERVEEDLSIEMEGQQATLYQAEIKRARAQLLQAEISQQLDKLRFNILTSLLRLRQICCHPQLLGFEQEKPRKGKKRETETGGESAKLAALIDLIEPLMEEGAKVLIFSQFVEMLALIEAEIAGRGWKSFKLTGQTEERGALVDTFQSHEGSAAFLISLKAGGSGLNLTAASYVVLFDPWWNPAVEAQAIDRTHRIGQKQTVFAYRLIVKNSIEEKIRQLQKQKGSLASDILGEENFAQALTLKDFQFLLGDNQ
jgi:superfamily II DNA or RNA helicase